MFLPVLIFVVFSFRWERRKEEKEEAETSVQHLHGSHKVDDTEVHLIRLFLELIIPTVSVFTSMQFFLGTISYLGCRPKVMLLWVFLLWVRWLACHQFKLFSDLLSPWTPSGEHLISYPTHITGGRCTTSSPPAPERCLSDPRVIRIRWFCGAFSRVAVSQLQTRGTFKSFQDTRILSVTWEQIQINRLISVLVIGNNLIKILGFAALSTTTWIHNVLTPLWGSENSIALKRWGLLVQQNSG